LNIISPELALVTHARLSLGHFWLPPFLESIGFIESLGFIIWDAKGALDQRLAGHSERNLRNEGRRPWVSLGAQGWGACSDNHLIQAPSSSGKSSRKIW